MVGGQPRTSTMELVPRARRTCQLGQHCSTAVLTFRHTAADTIAASDSTTDKDFFRNICIFATCSATSKRRGDRHLSLQTTMPQIAAAAADSSWVVVMICCRKNTKKSLQALRQIKTAKNEVSGEQLSRPLQLCCTRGRLLA